ncbi:unnamed protein product [Dovyalis caffra]|uniref:Uncharacterized protein n=1 Tax=Dovyalis caffra TaxID=77055 RepID=A0AAV1QZS6_9ROSI|nr:unnamed protein product [Dovyalis caffra]
MDCLCCYNVELSIVLLKRFRPRENLFKFKVLIELRCQVGVSAYVKNDFEFNWDLPPIYDEYPNDECSDLAEREEAEGEEERFVDGIHISANLIGDEKTKMSSKKVDVLVEEFKTAHDKDFVDFVNKLDEQNLIESDIVDVVEFAIKHHASDLTTKAMALIALLKLSSRFPSCSRGKCEPWNIYMHTMFRNSSSSWGAYFTALIIFLAPYCIANTDDDLDILACKWVRSITLDTWLPEQVAFMQSTGNSINVIDVEADGLICELKAYNRLLKVNHVVNGIMKVSHGVNTAKTNTMAKTNMVNVFDDSSALMLKEFKSRTELVTEQIQDVQKKTNYCSSLPAHAHDLRLEEGPQDVFSSKGSTHDRICKKMLQARVEAWKFLDRLFALIMGVTTLCRQHQEETKIKSSSANLKGKPDLKDMLPKITPKPTIVENVQKTLIKNKHTAKIAHAVEGIWVKMLREQEMGREKTCSFRRSWNTLGHHRRTREAGIAALIQTIHHEGTGALGCQRMPSNRKLIVVDEQCIRAEATDRIAFKFVSLNEGLVDAANQGRRYGQKEAEIFEDP